MKRQTSLKILLIILVLTYFVTRSFITSTNPLDKISVDTNFIALIYVLSKTKQIIK